MWPSCSGALPGRLSSHHAQHEGGSRRGLEDDLASVGFVSITVDPVRDTPERLLAFTEYHGVDWPHLTADNATLRTSGPALA
ncbi:MAG: hypothetical protein CM15mP128_1990 [Methanobacteriota archaeon]|nr:MAG: hypothetical protein CM15mP128_1990 [Euryarchaeota archaeon]